MSGPPNSARTFDWLRPLNSVDILLIDDSPEEIALFADLVAEFRHFCVLRVASNMQEALDALRNGNDRSRPSAARLIVLGGCRAAQDAADCLTRLKADPVARPIPVVVIGCPPNGVEVTQAYELRASCCIPRSADIREYTVRLRSLIEFWARTAQLPHLERSFAKTV